MMVGCGSASEEDIDLPVPPQPGQETPIAFSGSLSEEGAVTRTDPTEPAGLETVLPEGNKKFRVWAYKNPTTDSKQTVMGGYIVNWAQNTAYTTTSNTHDWEYVNQQTGNDPTQTIKYWDWGVSAYRFFGYTGASNYDDVSGNPATIATVNVSGDPATITISGIDATNPSGVPYFSRLWYHEPADDTFGKAVQLVFLQPIARVRIIFTFVPELIASNIGRDDLSDISFRPTNSEKNIAIGGTVTITYPLTNDTGTKESWSSGDGDATAFFDNPRGICIDSYKDNDDNWVNTWYNVLPRTSQGTYTLSVVVSGGEPKTCIVPAEFMTWAPGYQYTYIFKITETGGITLDNIQVGINDWHMVEQITHPVHNW